jgi:hypothetical protein
MCDVAVPELAPAPGYDQRVACWPLNRGEPLRLFGTEKMTNG